MPDPTPGPLPLLLFPQPTTVDRAKGLKMPPTLHLPGPARQAERLVPQFRALQAAFEGRRLELAALVPNEDPALVLVFETVGAVDDFIASAERVRGLEWLAATIDALVEPDDDFYVEDDRDKPLSGKLFLMGSNRQALEQLVRLWERHSQAQTLGPGLSAWKTLFAHLKTVRFWGPEDRLGDDLRQAWQFRLAHGAASLRFEIEAWHLPAAARNAAATAEVRSLVEQLGGRVLDERSIADIAYHGFLVAMPAAAVKQLLDGPPPPLLRSERVMCLRPQGQAAAPPGAVEPRLPDAALLQRRVSGPPVVALFDGLPIANHARLQGRLLVDDPNDWARDYPAAERVHGTAMASLICWGELDAASAALLTPLYVHPILQPVGPGTPREECTPDDRLLIDLVHVAVRRMFEPTAGAAPAAPTVRIINLSVGDGQRPFAGELSPWARLLDWLSHKYKVLFIVSSGNRPDDLVLPIPRESLAGLMPQARAALALQALVRQDMHRRLVSPAESVNALTVGACHADASTYPTVPGRYAPFAERGIAPYSRIGPGFRRSVKPDILMPGGRVLFRERPASPPHETHLGGLWGTRQPPGHRVAAPPDAAGDTWCSRGTSNAAALGTRAGAQAYAVLATLRAGNPAALPERFDAVLIKALLAHGASLGDIATQVLTARPDGDPGRSQRSLASSYAGYGVADVQRALTCTAQRATLLGVGDLRNQKACEFRVPIPEALNATLVRRRLTVTLAWLSPINPRHSKYRVARLWTDLHESQLGLSRIEGEWRQVQRGTLQHEIFEGVRAVPVVEGHSMTVRVNCVADAGRLWAPVEFALCVSLEIAEGVDLPIYQQVRDRIGSRVAVLADTGA